MGKHNVARQWILAAGILLLLIIIIVAILSSKVPTSAKENREDAHLFPVYEDDKWGYIDRDGEMVIKPQFVDAHRFSEGYAGVMLEGKWGFIDTNGSITVEPQYDYVSDFSEGLASVNVGYVWGDEQPGTSGCIDYSGAVVIELKYRRIEKFSEGLAIVHHEEGLGYIDKTGQLVINLKDGYKGYEYPAVGYFHEGLAVVAVANMVWGYMNKKGDIVIEPQFGNAHGFSDGLASVQVWETGKYGVIDSPGLFVIEPRFDDIGVFAEGVAFASIDREKYGIIDASGDFVVKPKFDRAHEFSEGLAPVLVGSTKDDLGSLRGGKWGYVNKKGDIVIKPQFIESVDMHFKNGLARVETEEEWGYINKKGEWVWKGAKY